MSEPLDVLGAAALAIDRLHRYLTVADSPAETATAARRLHDLAARSDHT